MSQKDQHGPGTYAVFNTSMGKIVCRLFADKAPKTVENFTGLAEGTREWTDPKSSESKSTPYYDGLIFHRVMDGFMIQGGDPTGTGYGGKSIWGVPFEDEFSPELRVRRSASSAAV